VNSSEKDQTAPKYVYNGDTDQTALKYVNNGDTDQTAPKYVNSGDTNETALKYVNSGNTDQKAPKHENNGDTDQTQSNRPNQQQTRFERGNVLTSPSIAIKESYKFKTLRENMTLGSKNTRDKIINTLDHMPSKCPVYIFPILLTEQELYMYTDCLTSSDDNNSTQNVLFHLVHQNTCWYLYKLGWLFVKSCETLTRGEAVNTMYRRMKNGNLTNSLKVVAVKQETTCMFVSVNTI